MTSPSFDPALFSSHEEYIEWQQKYSWIHAAVKSELADVASRASR